MYSYTAYRIGIRSQIELPEMRPGGSGAAATIRRGAPCNPGAGGVTDVTQTYYDNGPDGALLCWAGIGRFRVRGGSEIEVEPAAGAGEDALRAQLLGPALAVLLWQRGLLVLHASVVETATGAAAILGASGSGKSTTAAALVLRGRSLIADDIAAVDLGRDPPEVLPGLPHLKLHAEAASFLSGSRHVPRRIRPGEGKLSVRAARSISEPRPLERIYALAGADREAIELLSRRAALIELIRHTYIAKLLASGGTAENFRQCAGIARRIPVLRLQVPRSLPRLAAVADMLEADLDRSPA